MNLIDPFTDAMGVESETAYVRKLCEKQRKDLAAQRQRLQIVQEAIQEVSMALELSKTELAENRIRLKLPALT